MIRNLLVTLFIVFLAFTSFSQTRYWVASTPATWSSNNWSSTSGGAPDGGGPPSGVKDARFDGNGLGNCTVDVAASFADFRMDGYTGILDINGNSFTATETVILTTGTINDGAGTAQLTINSTDFARFNGTTFGADVNCNARGIDLDGSTFNGNFVGTINDRTFYDGAGGNTFNGNFTLNLQGNGGRIRMGTSNPDVFNNGVTINSTSGTTLEFADNSAGNTINGDLTVNLTDTSGTVSFSDGNLASLSISGNVNITHNVSSNAYVIFGDNGDISVGGNFTYTNTSTGANNLFYLANGTNSAVSIVGVTNFTNNATSTNNSRSYLGNNGDVTFNNSLNITNSSTTPNNQVYCHHNSNSNNAYNGNITLVSTGADSDGIYFGNSAGSGTLAATRTISIGGGGFSEGYLYLRNFTQTGATAQSLTVTGNLGLVLYGCNFGGDVNFASPRMSVRESTFSSTTILTKTGSNNDDNYGGNTFTGDVTFNHTGANTWTWQHTNPDTFGGNVTLNNSSSGQFNFAHQGGNTTVAGNLEINISNTANNFFLARNELASLTVSGDLNLNNTSTASSQIYIGYDGDVSVTGNLIINNNGTDATNQGYIADQTTSTVTVGGKLVLNHSGGTSNGRFFVCDDGDLTVGDSLVIRNSSSASNSQIYVGDGPDAVVTLNGHVSVSNSNPNSDGIYFGDDATSTVALAATRTLSIGSAGFAQGELSLWNLTQVGATPQSITLTGDAMLDIDNCAFVGNVTFSAGRLFIDNSTFSGTANLTKTSSGDDQSEGGNTFTGDVVLTNSGTNDIRWGNSLPDTFGGNLTINNTGSDLIQLARSSKNNTIAGNLVINTSGTTGAPNVMLANDTSSSIQITGTVTVNNTASGTSNVDIYLVNQGDATFQDDIVINNSATGNTAQVWVATSEFSDVTMNGDLTIINDGNTNATDIIVGDDGDVDISGNVVLNNSNASTNADIFVADNSTSQVTIGGDLTITNSGSGNDRYVYIGDAGDVIVNGNTSITNSSDASNSFIRVGYRSDSEVTFNGNLTLEQTNADSDEISFGDSGGTVTLSAGYLASIGGAGFSGGNLVFRNFNQLGATAQTFTITGTGNIENYDAAWGGNVSFTAPRIYTRGTTYSGTSSFTKTGSGNDRSNGGNIFTSDVTFTHTGEDQFALGDGTADTFGGNVTYNNTSNGGDFEIGYNSAGNTIAGNLVINHTPFGGNADVVISRNTNSSVTISGSTTITNGGTPANAVISLGSNGDLTFNDDVTITNNSTSGNSTVYLGQGTNSQITINGNLSAINSGSGDNERIFVGDNGDVSLNGSLTLNNNSSATTSEIYLADSGNSTVTVTGLVDVDNNSTGNNSRIYLNHYGNVTFSSNVALSNNSGSANSEFRCNYRSGSSTTFNGNIVLENTNAAGDGITFGENGGTATIAAGQTLTIGAGGFNSGDLEFRNFTRTGATATNLTCTGTARIYSYDSNWGGDVSFAAPRILLRGSTFSGETTVEKTGSGDDASAGGNTFSGNLTATNSGSSYLMFGNGTFDTYSGNVTLNNTGSDEIYFAYNGLGHTVSGNLILNNLGTSGNTNIIICDRGTSSLTVNGTTTVTNNGSGTNCDVRLGDDGLLTLQNDLTITNTGNATNTDIYVSNGSGAATTINGNVSITNTGAGTNKIIRFGNNGDVTITGNLSLINNTSANNADFRIAEGTNSAITVSGNLDIENSATGADAYVYVGNNGDITVNSNVTALNASGAADSEIRFNYSSNSQGNYNGSITLENTDAASDGISFCRNNGTTTLAAGQTIAIGAGGFNGGDLFLRNFTQTGATAQSLTLTTNARFYPYNSTFGGDFTLSAPQIYMRETTFSGNTSLTQSGSSNIISFGGNTFNGDLSFTVSGTGYFGFANNSANDYNGDVTLVQTGSGYIRPDYNRDCTISGDLNLNLTTVTRFGDAGGSITFDGTGNQSINDLGPGVEHIFEEMIVNKSGGELTINTPIFVDASLTLTNGIVNTNTTNTLTIADNASVSGASNASHIVGPVNKQGNDAFTFPVGDGTTFRPIGIDRVTSTAVEFQATYNGNNPGLSFDLNLLDGGLNNVSSREFWILDRVSGSASADVVLSWDANSGGITNISELRIARWDGAQWVSEGISTTTGDVNSGTITSSDRVGSFSPFALGSSTANNPLPVDLLSFSGKCHEQQVKLNWVTATELNNDYFEIFGSKTGDEFFSLGKIQGRGNSNELTEYEFIADGDYQYFFLKQFDFNGASESSETIFIEQCQLNFDDFEIYPNPARNEAISIIGNELSGVVKIYDATGRFVFGGFFNQNLNVPARNFKPGVYFVSVDNGYKVVTKKLVVQ